MSRKLLCSAVVAAALSLASGCGNQWNDPSIPAGPSNDIVPLALGNEWTYVDSTFSRTGALQAVDSTRLLISAHGRTQVQGVAYDSYDWTWVDALSGAPDSVSFVVGTVPNGLMTYGMRWGGGVYTHGRVLQLRYPVYLNDSWTGTETVTSKLRGIRDTTFTYQCSAPRTRFHTSPLDSSECTEYEYKAFVFDKVRNDRISHRYELDLLVRPGVGYLGFVEKVDDVIVASRRLRSYRLMPASSPGTSLTLPPPRSGSGADFLSLWRPVRYMSLELNP